MKIKLSLVSSIVLVNFLLISACQTGPSRLTTLPIKRTVASADLDKAWSYDPGPDPESEMGKELIELVATQPHMPGISLKIAGEQKFRPAFGPTLWRMIQKPNSVKILFIGQDGTHIAEAAGRTATAGFGGRAQDLAAYFGVKNSAAFINTFAFTITGQYADANAPVLFNNGTEIRFQGVTDNGMWLMAQDQNSPMVKWRNSLIDWIIRNNNESLQMIVLFGQAAKDSIATFIESKGGQVGTFTTAQQIADYKIQVPDFKLTFAGGNEKYPMVLDQSNHDLAQSFLGDTHKLDYKKDEDQELARQTLSENLAKALPQMKINHGGIANSGLIHPAQLGGYNLDKIQINGNKTLSLKGLPLSHGTAVKNEVLVVDLPHPTYLSSKEMEQKGSASKMVAKNLEDIQPYVKAGWKITPDDGMVNAFAKGDPYTYGRTDIGPAYYDFGTPNNRMVSKSDAVRAEDNVIILGTRDRAPFDENAIQASASLPKPEGIATDEMFSARSRSKITRYKFDPGPGEEFARIMKENIHMDEIGKAKKGADPATAFMFAYNIKTHPESVGAFGHYRGTFVDPKVVILADPDGVDDMLTSRALTGARGQYLQGLMNDLGVPEQYLVIKTVPFGMDGADESEWRTVLSQTANYRKALFSTLLKKTTPMLFIADGKYASQEIQNLVGKESSVLRITRSGTDNNSGIAEAASQIAKLPHWKDIKYTSKMANIPRSHLGFYSRVWEGTSGTRVFNSNSKKYFGIAFAVVAPEWAFMQQPEQDEMEIQSIKALQDKVDDLKLLHPKENYLEYLQRIKINALDYWLKFSKAA